MLRRAIVGRVRERRARLEWLAQAAVAAEDAIRHDAGREDDSRHHTAKVSPDHPDYADKVAKPVMEAVDGMAPEWRELIGMYGYVDVYRAWRRGMSAAKVRQMAEANGGRFVL